MKKSAGLVIALAALSVSCSDMGGLGRVEVSDNRRQVSLDASQPLSVEPSWVFQTFEDQSFQMDILANQWKTTANIQLLEKPELGSLIYDSGKSSWVYQPNADVAGEDRFSIELLDSSGKRTVQPVVANILAVNDAPKTQDILLRLPEDSSIEFDIPVEDPEQSPVSLKLTRETSNGSVEAVGDGSLKIRYTPNANFSGEDSMVVTLNDGELESQATVTFEVMAINDGIIAADGFFETNAGSAFNGSLNWVDPNSNQPITNIEIIRDVTEGDLVIDPNQGDFVYTPRPGYEGDDEFHFRVIKGTRRSNIGKIRFRVNYTNQPPSNCYPNCPQPCPGGDCPSHPPSCPGGDCPSHPPSCPSGDCPDYPSCPSGDCPSHPPSCPSGDCPDYPSCPSGDCPDYPSCPSGDCPSHPQPGHPNQWDVSITCPRTGACYGQIHAEDLEHDKFYYRFGSSPQFGDITDWNQHNGTFTYHPHGGNNHVSEDHFTFWLEDCYGNRSRDYTFGIIYEEYSWTFLQDSFERQQLFSHDPGFHWRFLLDDNGKGIQENDQECKDHICAKIFGQHPYGFGPMADQDKSLFMFGREGQSTHKIFLVSKNFDLSQYSKVDVSFKYLIMDIGDNDSRQHEYTEEYLKAEVCLFGDYECGLNPVDPYRLKSDRWKTVFVNNRETAKNDFNGRNHSRHDWKHASFQVDLSHLESQYPGCHRSNFVFRFKSRLQDGFRNNNYYKNIEDAVAIDFVKMKAQ
ncbi:Ig-like domain-containing protein [Pseudobacteriovorax antillogorgiicola]|uniref:Tandem-95 repeat protein n=1 Tax=Pseudobacteriovorax antillogorgiicola TaxID=1513793 RepID=A0A1Y6CJV9_9BACT|nr:Ig-like domain-containing protein [Pseudobacteriovorax antillogorgiicola]TCS47908.1 hypothetical protein EDD56_11919 [Pseudobacteriovorax antillogorgiicola]SMF57831.1 hypothetical protein SAMN06296036_11920 [Pseudobacteriovorax antillogorgiicola]